MSWRRLAAGVAGCLALLLWLPRGQAFAASGVSYETSTSSYGGKSFTVSWVTADLSDPHLRVMPVTAEDGIGHVESFGSLMERSDAVAGVNGTFFDAYEADDSKRHPNGLMIDSGGFVRSGENVALAIRTNKTALIHRLTTQLNVKVKHGKSSYSFKPWGVNTYYSDDVAGQVIGYTRAYASVIDKPGGAKVIVESGKITAITESAANVPESGYVFFIGHTSGNDRYLLPNLHTGDEMELEATVADGSNWITETAAQAWESAIGVGPKLVTAGAVDVDAARDGFSDPSMVSSANIRSFVGVDGAGRLVLGTISSATLQQMANVLAGFGFQEAMNMDGGASSGLYYDGTMKRTPGRLLSNALVIKWYDQPQVQVVVNDRFVNEFRGFVQQDVTMVPFRGILERIGAEFSWNDQNRVLTAKRGKTELTLRPDVAEAVVNGKPVKLQQAPVIVDGHIYVPLRFVAETLGATVAWDQALYRTSLQLK
ncbi:stalk domain-containing protein [Paenibacillus cremeus]|uniref:Copper amine oxidase n=1 Tax=Paenibacillus cremeus TaxID=2163881 RepID=A0A559K403_9BACL|nr:stalk domain-containing protein [Paenibacillus cremeus]TVY06862.1 hypothetical protein FPZ49_27080 [Paenibacillus cremeus]